MRIAAALAAAAVLSSCGPSAAERTRREAADRAERDRTRADAAAFARSADGSAYRAVAGMMDDPATRSALGLPAAAPAPVRPDRPPAR